MSANLTITLFRNLTSTSTLGPNTSNVTQEATDDITLGDRKWFNILKYTLFSIIFLISLGGNVLVCFVVSRRMKLKTVTNYFIMNLAIADLLYTLCIPFDVYATVNKAWPYGSFVCQMLWPVETLTVTVSGFTLTALSVTRYWAVVNPLRRQISIKHSHIVIGLLWGFATSTIIPYIIYLKHISDKCKEVWPHSKSRKIYTASLFVIQYAVPLAIITTCYVRIGLELTKGPQTYNRMLAKARGQEARKVIKMLIIVTLTFAVLTLPSSIMWMWLDFGEADQKFKSFWDLMEILYILDFLNSATNPIIYSFCNESFSREFRRHLGCILPTPPPSESESGRFTFVGVGSSSPSSPAFHTSCKEKKESQDSKDSVTLV